MQFGWDDKPKRKPVRASDRKHLLEFQNGKCGICKKPFKQLRVRKIAHHKNLNPKDNRIVNLVLVCPNCHDKIHQNNKKVRVKTTDSFWFIDYKVKVIKKKDKKKYTAKKKKKVPAERDIFGNVIRWKYVSVNKPKKITTKNKTTKTKRKHAKKPKHFQFMHIVLKVLEVIHGEFLHFLLMASKENHV